MRTFSRDTLTFPVTEIGSKDKEIIVLLHGFPATAHSLLPIANKLALDGYRVLLPELRGYAPDARPKRRRDYSLNELVEDVRSLIDTVDANRVHVVGHDWGGAVAWAFTSAYPERVTSLTVISAPHPKAFARSLWTSRQIFMSWYMFVFQLPYIPEWIITRNEGAVLLRVLTKSGLNLSSASDYVKKMQDRDLAAHAIDWYRALPYNMIARRQTGPITRPTLFVFGGEDHFLSGCAASLTKKWVKGHYEERFLPDIGHWIPEECPDKLADHMLRFIETTSSSSSKIT